MRCGTLTRVGRIRGLVVIETSRWRLRLRQQGRAGHEQMLDIKRDRHTCHYQDCRCGRKWLAFGWSPATIAAGAIGYVFLSFGYLLKANCACPSFWDLLTYIVELFALVSLI